MNSSSFLNNLNIGLLTDRNCAYSFMNSSSNYSYTEVLASDSSLGFLCNIVYQV